MEWSGECNCTTNKYLHSLNTCHWKLFPNPPGNVISSNWYCQREDYYYTLVDGGGVKDRQAGKQSILYERTILRFHDCCCCGDPRRYVPSSTYMCIAVLNLPPNTWHWMMATTIGDDQDDDEWRWWCGRRIWRHFYICPWKWHVIYLLLSGYEITS